MSFPLQIDGVDLPAPSAYKFSEADLVTNANRNDAGYANWDVVRFNVGRLDLTWEGLSRDDIARIVSAIRNKQKFRCTFLNTTLARRPVTFTRATGRRSWPSMSRRWNTGRR